MTGAEGFSAFIRSLGFEPPPRMDPGQWTPFSTNGKGSDTAGRARLFPDGEGGFVYDWRSGESWTWQAHRERVRTPEEQRLWRAKIERAKRDAEAERTKLSQETAQRARRIWDEAKPATDAHPYSKSKGVPFHGLRLYRGALALNSMKCEGALIIPARTTSGEIVSLSFISPAGEKRYLSGPRSPGAYFSIGKANGTVCIAEGFATGASIHEATGHAVAVAFDAGNLEPVARALRGKYPQVQLIVCADDDAATEGNPGVTKATAAARAVGALVAVPDFGGERPAGATDFNDLARSQGAEAVRRCIDAAAEASAEPQERIQNARGPVEGIEVICADRIKPQPVHWLWDGFLARGKVHIIAGAPGTGKTTLALGFIAALTSGGRWPDGSRAMPASALIWSGEDSPADTLVPRLIAAGARLDRVHFVGDRRTVDGVRSFDPAQDFADLELEAARIPELGLVIVDPVVSAIAGDSHKSADVRRGLQPLVRFAERIGCAVLGISHFSKGTAGKDPVERVTGSIAFGALARVVLATAKVPEEEGGGRIMVRAKSNIGPDGGGFRYELRVVDLGDEHSGIAASRPEWLGTLDGEARELLAAAETQADPDERSATSEAIEALRHILSAGRIQTKDARRRLQAEGFTPKQIRTAREKLGVKRDRDGFGGADFWHLPDSSRSCPQPSVDAHPERVGTNGHERDCEGMNGEPKAPNDAELMALVDRVAAHFGTRPQEIETMRETARERPTEAWRTLTATAQAEGIA